MQRYDSGILYGSFQNDSIVKIINWLINSDGFYLLTAALCALAFTFSLEPMVYTIYAVLITWIFLFGDRVERFLIVVPFFYIAPSVIHNPAVFPDSIFRQPGYLLYIAAVMVIPVLLMGIIFLRNLILRKKKVPSLWLGYLLLGIAYLCSGQGSDGAGIENTAFAFLEILSVSLFYFVGYYVIDEKKHDEAMFAKIGAAMGLALLVEVFDIYMFSGLFARGYLNRGNIYTGWGIHNNLGNMLCVCIPCVFLLMYRGKRKLWWFLYAVVLLAGVFLTTSRGSVLTGIFLFLLSFLTVIVKLHKLKVVKWLVLLLAAATCLGIIAFIILWDQSAVIQKTVQKVLKVGLFNDSNRFESWRAGIAQFQKAPVFGKGFYECSAYIFHGGVEGYLPARWHNTVIQLLAACGAVGLVSYVIHRCQTIWLFLRIKTIDGWFIALSIFAILLGSMTDNHFFNVGPGIVYGIFLAFANGMLLKNNDVKPLKKDMGRF